MIRVTACLLMALAQPAGAFDLALPVACSVGDDCFIQKYFDHDPGKGRKDFLCGHLIPTP